MGLGFEPRKLVSTATIMSKGWKGEGTHISGTVRIQTQGPKHFLLCFLQAIFPVPSGRNTTGKTLEPRFNLVSILFESNLEPESSGEICSQQQGFLWRSFDLRGTGWLD